MQIAYIDKIRITISLTSLRQFNAARRVPTTVMEVLSKQHCAASLHLVTKPPNVGKVTKRGMKSLGDESEVGLGEWEGAAGGFAVADEYLHEGLGENDIVHVKGAVKQGCYLLVGESGYAATYACNQKCGLIPLVGEVKKLIDIGADGINATLHGGYGIRVALDTDPIPPLGSETLIGNAGSSSDMDALKIAAKHENFVLAK